MSTALVPFEQLNTMAAAFAKSGMFGAKTPEQALSLLLLAQAEGVHPAVAMRDYDIIQGRPSKKSQAMHRAFLEAGGKIEWHRRDDTGADATFSHPQGGTVRVAWDEARAKKAGLSGKDMYGKYGRQMYSARVISEGCRTVYPAATSGLYVPEEVVAFAKPAEKNMGAVQVVADDDPDITNDIPGVVPPAGVSPSPSSLTPAGGVVLISNDQAMELAEKLVACDANAEKDFLKIAKLDKLTSLKAEDYDEALDWVKRRESKKVKA